MDKAYRRVDIDRNLLAVAKKEKATFQLQVFEKMLVQ